MALALNSPTPRRLRRPDHPNLFLLGFSTHIPSFSLFLQLQAGQGVGRRAGHGRGGAGRGGAGQGRGPNRRVKGLRFGVVARDQCWSRGEPVPVPGPDVGATVPWLWRDGQAHILGRSAPSRWRGLSAAHPRRWARV